jgi:hypothetical protein
MLNDRELKLIRKDFEKTVFTDVCNILSLSQASDGEGGLVDTWGTATANIPCRLDSLTSRGVGFIGSEMVRNGSLKSYSTWIITLPYDTALTSANRVQVGSDVFNVVETDASKSLDITRRATLEKV